MGALRRCPPSALIPPESRPGPFTDPDVQPRLLATADRLARRSGALRGAKVSSDQQVVTSERSTRLPFRGVRACLAAVSEAASENETEESALQPRDQTQLAYGATHPATVVNRQATTIVMVLLTYRDGAPGGLEYGVAALADGLRRLGNRVVIVTAVAPGTRDTHVLESVRLSLPTTREELRRRLLGAAAIQAELRSLVLGHQADTVCYADPLRGLGAVAPTMPGVRAVLMVHAGDDREELEQAGRTAIDAVVATSATAVRGAQAAGVAADDEAIVSWGLLPSSAAVPTPSRRFQLRATAPVRIATCLRPDKGIADLLAAVPSAFPRIIEVALAAGPVEAHVGQQRALLHTIEQAVRGNSRVNLRPPLRWSDVPAFFAGSCLAVTPAGNCTFGSAALQAMRVGTPAVAVATGNLPKLLGPAGILVPPSSRFASAVWDAAASLLGADGESRYEIRSAAGTARAAHYTSERVASRWLTAISR